MPYVWFQLPCSLCHIIIESYRVQKVKREVDGLLKKGFTAEYIGHCTVSTLPIPGKDVTCGGFVHKITIRYRFLSCD